MGHVILIIKKNRPMADFVKDVTLPDRSYYPTDTILQKTWEMKNNGGIEWGDGVELVFLKGNETLALEKRYPVPNAKPEESVQISAMIRTPAVGGRYCAYFRLQKNGNKFGPRVWVDIFAVEESKSTQEASKTSQEASKTSQEASKTMTSTPTDQRQDLKQQKRETKECMKVHKKQAKEERKESKWQNRKEKLTKKLEKIDAKLCSIEENEKTKKDSKEGLPGEKEKDKSDMISCMCGAPLIQTTPVAAYYGGAHVNCDICGLYCPSTNNIYHCPAEKTQDHPKGYDLCVNCVRYQMRSFEEQQLRQTKRFEKIEEKQQSQQQSQPQQPVAPVSEKPKESTNEEKPAVETNVVVESNNNNSSDPLEGFLYANEARGIMNMGFSDIEKIKYLLISKKGDSNQVIAALLSH